MDKHQFKTDFKIENLPISIGYQVMIEDNQKNSLMNVKVIGGLKNKLTNEIDRIGVTRNKEQNEWDNIMIIPKDNIMMVISEDGKQEWKRIDGGKFIKQETKNARRYHVRTTRNSNRNNTIEDEGDIELYEVRHPSLKKK